MCKLCEKGHKIMNVIYVGYSTENNEKVMIPVCPEKMEQFKHDLFKLRRKHVGRTLHLPDNLKDS